jgi:hypothetical protein
MPEISRFLGIVIAMYWESRTKHHRPHFHAKYQEHEASFSIDPVELIAGSLPIKQRHLVEGWAELHTDELKENWDLLISDSNPKRIRPLA